MVAKRQVFYAWVDQVVRLDICVVTETRFREGVGDSLMAEVIDEEEFSWFGRDRRKQRSLTGDGGVGILVRKSLGEVKVAKVSQNWDSIWIQIKTPHELVFVGAVYMSPAGSPRVDSEEYIQELEADIAVFREKGIVMVMGDLNSRIGSKPSKIFAGGQVLPTQGYQRTIAGKFRKRQNARQIKCWRC